MCVCVCVCVCGWVEKFPQISLISPELPAQLPFGQYQGHQQKVGPHAKGPEAEDESRLSRTTWMTLEHLGRVRRNVARRADAESQIGPDHRHQLACFAKISPPVDLCLDFNFNSLIARHMHRLATEKLKDEGFLI